MRGAVTLGALILVSQASTGCSVPIQAFDSPQFKIKATLAELWDGTGSGVPASSSAKIPLLPDIPLKPGLGYVKFPVADGDAGLAIPISDEFPRERLQGGTLRFFLTNDLPVQAIVHVVLAVARPYTEADKIGGAAVIVDKVVPAGERDLLAYENFGMADLAGPGSGTPLLDAKELRLGVGVSTMGSRGVEVAIRADAALAVDGRIHWSVVQEPQVPFPFSLLAGQS